MAEEIKPLTWRDIKEFSNSLSEDDLDKNAVAQEIDGESTMNISDIEVFDEDWVYIEDSDGSIPISQFKSEDNEGMELHEIDHRVLPKGSIIIWME